MQTPEKMGLSQGQAVNIPGPLTENQNQLFSLNIEITCKHQYHNTLLYFQFLQLWPSFCRVGL